MKTQTPISLLTCLISCNLFAFNHHGIATTNNVNYVQANNYRSIVNVPYFNKGIWFNISGLYLKPLNEGSNYDWDYSMGVGTLLRETGNDLRFVFSHYDSNSIKSSSTFNLINTNTVSFLADSEIGLVASGAVDAEITMNPAFADSLTHLGIPVNEQNIIIDAILQDLVPGVSITNPNTTLALQSTSEITLDAPTDFTLAITPTMQSFTCDSKVNTFDLDVGQYLNINPYTQLRFFGGLRYLKLEQHLTETLAGSAVETQQLSTTSDVAFDGILGDETSATAVILIPDLITLTGVTTTATFDGTAAIQTLIQQRNKTDAIGPRVGADLSYRLRGGFEITGRCAGAFLVSHRDSILDSYNSLTYATSLSNPSSTLTNGTVSPADTSEILNLIDIDITTPPIFDAVTDSTGSTSSATTEIDTHYKAPNKNNLISNIDLKLGIKYDFGFLNNRQPHLVVEAGYFGTYYFNAINELRIDGDLANPNQQLVNRSFAGPYLSLAVVL